MWTKMQIGMTSILNAFVPVVKTINTDQSLGEGDIKNIQQLANGFSSIVKNIVGSILAIIGVIAVIYAIYLGVMYAKAESADKRKEVQGRLIGACIGAVIIIAGATLCFALDWAAIYHNFSVSGHKFTDANNDGICDLCKTSSGSSSSGSSGRTPDTSNTYINMIKLVLGI